MGKWEIATRAEIESLFERAAAVLDRAIEPPEEYDPEEHHEQAQGIAFAIEAMRFCAVAAKALGDPALGGLVIDAIRLTEHWEGYAEPHPHAMQRALTGLLRAGLPLDARVRELARDENADLRETVASGLDPRGAAERTLLEELARDPASPVRKAARERLAEVVEVPWWSGKWKSDPAARLLPEEREAGGAALRKASEILELPNYSLLRKRERLDELCEALGALPAELALEPIEQIARATEHHFFEGLAPLLLLLLDRPGGIDALERLVDAWGNAEYAILYESPLRTMVQAAPPATRLALSRRLMAKAVSAPVAQRIELGKSPAWLAASLAAAAWLPGEDIAPVLDTLLGMGEEELPAHATDYVRSKLSDILELEGVDPTPVLDRLVEARLAGHPGPWKQLAHDADVLLGRAPAAVLRPIAERALASEEKKTRSWAVETLLGPAFDPALDGARVDRAVALVADPRVLAVVLDDRDLVGRTLPALRAKLRRGELSYPEAVAVFEGIDRLYGGLSDGTVRIGRSFGRRAEDPEEKRAAARAEVEAFLGPAELAGPVAAEEWAALRRARDAYTPEDPDEGARLWSRVLSPGPWTAEERAELDELFGQFRAGQSDLDFALCTALMAKPDPDLLPLVDEIVSRCRPHARALMKHMREDLRVALGLPARPAKEGAGAAAEGRGAASDELPGGAWDDDEEEGGDGGA